MCVAMKLVVILMVVHQVLARGPLRSAFPRHDAHHVGGDPGQPLLLTPYIETGDIATAQKLSQVSQLNGTSVRSYSGFLTVNKTYNSNMFFWFFPSTAIYPEKQPFLLWLQGGPGGSSLFGLFVESGPFGVDANIKLFPRKFAWTDSFNMLYIDNPVGTGFSFTDSDQGYATNEAEVGENLYRAMVQVFKLFPKYKSAPFYITGESYAGKYIPALGHRIHSDPSSTIKLAGVAIGDGFTDPPTMLPTYADYIHQIGMMDSNQADYFSGVVAKITKLISQRKFHQAFLTWDLLLGGDTTGVPSFWTNCTGTTDYFNYLRTTEPADYDYYNQYLQLAEVRKAIHVGELTYHSGEKVEQHLINDMLQSVKPWLAELMDNYKVLLYTGQLDVIVGLPLTDAMLDSMQWSGREQYRTAARFPWRTDPFTEVSGYVKKVNNFYQIVIRGGGHILPYDQPHRTYDMMRRFILGRQFN